MDDYKEGSWWETEVEAVDKREESQAPERELEPVMSDRCGVTLEYVISLMEKKRALAAYAC